MDDITTALRDACDTITALRAERDAAYRKGAEDMRERAAAYHEGAVERIRSDASSYSKNGPMKTDRKKASNIHEDSAAAIRKLEPTP